MKMENVSYIRNFSLRQKGVLYPVFTGLGAEEFGPVSDTASRNSISSVNSILFRSNSSHAVVTFCRFEGCWEERASSEAWRAGTNCIKYVFPENRFSETILKRIGLPEDLFSY